MTLISLAIGSLAAYALGRFRFRGRSFVLYLMLSMTIFPQIAILGALYTMFSGFHIVGPIDFPKLYDIEWALIFSYLIFTLPFTIWVLTSFMRALPGRPRGGGLRRRRDAAAGLLQGAAAADRARARHDRACSPSSRPGTSTSTRSRSSRRPSHYTVPVAITSFTGASGNAFQIPWGQMMAATVIVTLPLIVATCPAETDPRRPHGRRRQGLDRRAASRGSKK